MRRDIGRNSTCPCGSGRKAKLCCLRPNGILEKSPANLVPPMPYTGYQNPKCFMRSTSNCSEKITGEHVFPQSVLRQIGKEGVTRVAGMKWQEPETFQDVGIASLTANVLCARHNSGFSGLDMEISRLSEAIERVDNQLREQAPPSSSMILFSGDDIERWMLKASIGAVAAKQVQGFLPEDSVRILTGEAEWGRGTGMWMTTEPKETLYHSDSIAVQPVVDERSGGIVWLDWNIRGIPFRLVVRNDGPQTPLALHRPQSLLMKTGRCKRELLFSWTKGAPGDSLVLDRVHGYDGAPPNWAEWMRK